MGRPRKDAFDEDTRDRVLRAAEEAFGDRGYASARLADIAAGASIRRPSLLYHFASKELLYGAVIERAVATFAREAFAAAREARERPEATAIIDLLVSRLSTLARSRPALIRLVARALIEPEAIHDQVKQGARQVIDVVVATIEAGLAEPPPVPLQAAITLLVIDWIMRVGAGAPGQAIWGDGETSQQIARWLVHAER